MNTNRMTTLFRVGAGLLALHVADDTFFQPPAGTTATDHLASGLIPIGLLLIAAIAYPRLRPAARGLLGMTIGVLGVVAGIEAVYYSLEVGPSGDDFTGLLAIPAGLGLLGLGAVTLWRGRSFDRSRPVRYGLRVLLTAVVLLGADSILFPTAFGYLVTHISSAAVPEADLGAAYEDVAFTTEDGLELEGWYVAVPKRRGRDRLPRPRQPAEADSDAGRERLRRPTLRSPRRRCQRWSAQRLRLGRRARHRGGDCLPGAPATTSTPAASAASDYPSAAS